ncbi:uncharacterized protein LOC111897204 [Lactuca sativa]|uniref:uncharacterized protein LOC111897204 n=1 Tax=Lactuca sativa TaxID=4236 RepID=UPI000CD82865|nr:uncharacterized protein LOC111897204 [Lactuca sativa]
METGSEGESDRNINGESDGSKRHERQMKTRFQRDMLEKTYAVEMYPLKDTKEKLSGTLGLTDRQVQRWFNNRRLRDNKRRTAKRAGRGGVGRSHNGSFSARLQCKDTNQTMEKLGVLKFEVGQLAETKTFEKGYRSAWFKCKIKDISLKKNKILPEYYDFPDEKIKWANMYEIPPYGRKSKNIKKQLMVRPQYPQIYHKNEMPPVNSITEVCVIIDGVWKSGDLVDWFEDDCYWSASIIKILSDERVKIELPKPPAGQGKVYIAFCKDLRPSLDWSPSKGWIVPTMRGRTSCNAQLIFPSPKGMDIEKEEIDTPLNVSSTSRTSVISLEDPMEEIPNSQEVKIDGDDVEKVSSSDSISTMRVEENKTDDDDDDDVWDDVDHNMIDLNIMHEKTLEASILDLEELANRIKWLRAILENNQSGFGSWMFAKQHSSTKVT